MNENEERPQALQELAVQDVEEVPAAGIAPPKDSGALGMLGGMMRALGITRSDINAMTGGADPAVTDMILKIRDGKF